MAVNRYSVFRGGNMSLDGANNQLLTVLNAMKRSHREHAPADAPLRQDRLRRAISLLRDNHNALAQAISDDFGHRSVYQTWLADIGTTIKMLQHATDNLTQWMQPEITSAAQDQLKTWIQYQPLGVIGIISPWNFPLNLAFGPLADIFAAGNTAMLKPSELTPRTSELLAELVPRYFSSMELAVVLGDAQIGQVFSGLPFDHLVFTGSTTVGRHVMRAAAENLVPVTLELGGKSPVVIGESANMADAVSRTLTVKTFNAGQICLSPDYVIIQEGQEQQFISEAQHVMQSAFPRLQANPDYTSIISARHFSRLLALLEDAQQQGAQVISLAPQGEAPFDADSRKIAPHLLFGVHDGMAVMQEEIFGPLLPIMSSKSQRETVSYINQHPRPLAAYLFSHNLAEQRYFAERTTSGALVINDVMTHASIDSLPFGGVGASGIGAYHGIHGFRRFSHARAMVEDQSEGSANLRLRAPYHDKMHALSALWQA
jgi:coniferyl-aldehyde dehydrogenase